MNKNFVTNLSAALLVLVLCCVGYWFFKSHQIKKQINTAVEQANSFIAETYKKNSTSPVPLDPTEIPRISIGEIKSSGFPLSHKIIIKDLKISSKDGSYAIIKNVSAEVGAFSSTFSLKLLEPLIFGNIVSHVEGIIELSTDNQFRITLAKDRISKFKYECSGLKVLDGNKNLILAAEFKDYKSEYSDDGNVTEYISGNSGFKLLGGNNNIILSTSLYSFDAKLSVGEDKKITAKLTTNLKDFEYFGIDPSTASKSEEKHNFAIDGSITLTPPEPETIAANLKNLEFSSPLYKISISGSAFTFVDDRTPSGEITIKIENLDALISNISGGIKKISSEISKSEKAEPAEMFISEAEQSLSNISSPLKELAAKNPLSKENFAVFEIKRVKGSNDFSINKMNTFEVIGILFSEPQNAGGQNHFAPQQPRQNFTAQPIIPKP